MTAATVPLRGKVLYIEDSDISFESVAGLLVDQPEVVLLRAESGTKGVEAARRESPNVILLDMRLPDMSGLEVVRMLSEDIAARRFRVVILTADSLNIEVLKAMSLGAFEYLVKPVSHAALASAIRRALTPAR